MRRIIVPILAALLVAVVASSAGAFENVKFKSTDTGFGVREPVLTGKLYRPAGKGPFPAAVLLHGCGGMTKRDRTWAEKLAGWGIFALAVDSFGPRGYSRVCDNRDLSRYLVPRRVRDAYDAKAYLAGLPFVDPGRIGVMGWSHGGHIVLQTVKERNVSPFKAAIAFYPLCDLTLNDFNAPLLILIGGSDSWTPAARCTENLPPEDKRTSEVVIKVYPGAYHGFDAEGADTYVRGVTDVHRVAYNAEAAADANRMVKEYLEKYLK
ncbi:MAG TPA: dienelactone hydrolase family protein [Syntrophales bacterium]|jgi:dienelactone hydrolase|nr:dienelactone hydrolase family protein [Syntrophales bacterium]